MIRIYLDNCVYNRLYDYVEVSDEGDNLFDVLQMDHEKRAVLKIINRIKSGIYDGAYSFMSEYENNRNPFEYKRSEILKFLHYCKIYVPYDVKALLQDKIISFMNNYNLHYQDAVHLACAVYADCDYLLTVDKRFINAYKGSEINIINPIDLEPEGDI